MRAMECENCGAMICAGDTFLFNDYNEAVYCLECDDKTGDCLTTTYDRHFLERFEE